LGTTFPIPNIQPYLIFFRDRLPAGKLECVRNYFRSRPQFSLKLFLQTIHNIWNAIHDNDIEFGEIDAPKTFPMDNGIFCTARPCDRTPRLPNKYRINLVANRIRANLRSRNQNPPIARTEIDNAL